MTSFLPNHPPDRALQAKFGPAIIWILLVLSGIVLRVHLLLKYPDLWFDSDEANLGLMALHLLRDGKFHIFIAGESYGGCLGVAVISLFTLLTGSPFLGIKLAPLLFFVLFAASLFALGRQLFNTAVGLIAVALVSFSSAFLTAMGVRERGPHPETLFLGTLLMWLTCRLSGREVNSGLAWAGWGALVGFAWYTHYISIFYIAPCVLFLLLNKKLLAWRPLLWAPGGFLAGSLLYWVFVFRYFDLPPFGSAGLKFFDPWIGLKNFLLVGFPILAGTRWSFHQVDLVPVFSKLVVFIYGGALLFFFFRIVRDRVSLRNGKVLLAMVIVSCPPIFAFSSFAWFAAEPRYLMSLCVGLSLVLAWFVWELWRQSKLLAATAMILVTGVSVYGSVTVPAEVFNTIFAEPNTAVIRFAREKGLKHFYANYWIVYRLMFETQEELVGANYFDITRERYPKFKQRVDQDPNPSYIAWESEAPGFQEKLQKSGRHYQHERIGRYVVFYNVRPRLPPPP